MVEDEPDPDTRPLATDWRSMVRAAPASAELIAQRCRCSSASAVWDVGWLWRRHQHMCWTCAAVTDWHAGCREAAWLLCQLCSGFSVPWHTTPPAPSALDNYLSASSRPKAMDAHVRKLLLARTVEVVPDPAEVTVVPLALVGKGVVGEPPDDAQFTRIVIDMARQVNDAIRPWRFRYADARAFVARLRSGDYVGSADFSGFFHQLPLHPADRNACCVRWRGVVYRYRRVVLGIKLGPAWASTASAFLLDLTRPRRPRHVKATVFIDDSAWWSARWGRASAALATFVATCRRARVGLAAKKLTWPARSGTFIGVRFGPDGVGLPADKALRWATDAVAATESASVTVSWLRRFAGRVQWAACLAGEPADAKRAAGSLPPPAPEIGAGRPGPDFVRPAAPAR